MVLQGNLTTMPETLGELHCLPLAERDLGIGRRGSAHPNRACSAVAMGLLAFDLIPVTVAFFGAAVHLAARRELTLREAYEAIDWPILVMLGALIPVSEALRSNRRQRGDRRLAVGGGGAISAAIGALALMLAAAMAVTPFLNNAATVLVMAPIAASFAGKLGSTPMPS